MASCEKEWLLGKGLDELREIAAAHGLKPFAAAQLADWMYKKRVDSIGAMSNLPAAARERLSQMYQVGRIAPCDVQVSADGTKKYLFPTLSGHSVEAVYIPDGDRATLCVSSQAGCRMGCRFCMTARQGFQAHLSAGEILNQLFAIDEFDRLTNVVFMGMGEPLDNLPRLLGALDAITAPWGLGWSPTRLTVSSIGVSPSLPALLEGTKAHVAISLHNPFADERLALMPMQKAYPIAEVIEQLRKGDFAHQRRLSFEYILFEGVNDSDRHARGLLALLKGLPCRINLIAFHPIPDSPLRGSSAERIRRFNALLNEGGITTTTRRSRGQDIFAACGLLSTLAGERD